MPNSYDVAVIGSGMAGVTAAKAAYQNGASVCILSKGEGATVLGSGAIDILGVVPAEDGNMMVEQILDGINKLVESYPKHPYSILKDSLDSGVMAFLDICRQGGMHFFGDGIYNQKLPNTLGTVKTAAYLPYVSKDASLDNLAGMVLIAGFKGHSDFYSDYVCKSLNRYVREFDPECTAGFVSVTLELPKFSGRTKLTNSEMAEWLDTQEGISELENELKEYVAGIDGIDHILLPPVLGYRNYNANKDYLEESLKLNVSEVLSGGHSVAGQRMVQAMRSGIEKCGVDIFSLSTVERIDQGDNGLDLKVIKGGKEIKISAKTVVLATGGFIGGGLCASHDEIYASILKDCIGKVGQEMISKDVFAPGGQAFSRLGLKCYDDQRLAQGELSGRVYICGDIMEGYDWIYERSGGGVAIASGYLAGTNAAAAVKGGVRV